MGQIEYEDLSMRVYRALKEMVLKNELKSGEKLHQEKLAAKLGISRTPLLAAFAKLERELLIELVPRRGAFVRRFSRQELLDIYDIRLRLEPLGAFEAAHRADERDIECLTECLAYFRDTVTHGKAGDLAEADYRMHMAIMKAGKNEFLYQIVSSFNIIIIANIGGLPKPAVNSLREHEALLLAVQRQEAETAEKLMRDHILEGKKIVARKEIGMGHTDGEN